MSAAAMWARAAEVGFASVNSEGRVELDLLKVGVQWRPPTTLSNAGAVEQSV